MYKVIVGKKIIKKARKIPQDISKQIDEVIINLSKNPTPHNCLKMSGYENRYRIRVASYRIVYDIYEDELVVLVVEISHRKDVYKKMVRQSSSDTL